MSSPVFDLFPIACAVSVEVYEILKSDSAFDLDRYRQNLTRLPTVPWTDGLD